MLLVSVWPHKPDLTLGALPRPLTGMCLAGWKKPVWEERETDVDENGRQNERERERTKGERKKRPNKVEREKAVEKIVGCGFIEAKKTDQTNT